MATPLPSTHPGPSTATVSIDRDLCTDCLTCAKVCFGKPLDVVGGRVEIDPDRLFGCIACGACMSVCPSGAISVTGRDLSPDDVRPLRPADERASYDQLVALLEHRRSTRRFTESEVSNEAVERILDASLTGPMGIPPSEVGVLLLDGRDRVREFSSDTIAWMRAVNRWLRPMFPLFRPFMSRVDYTMFRDFIFPALDAYFEQQDRGVDWLMYDAPLAMVFYGTGLNDPADPYIPATLSMVAAESLGLGSCMLGFAGYGVFYSKRLRRKWGLPQKVRPGIAVIYGHPATRPRNSVRRRFSAVVRG
jgi:ferredoxin